MTLGTPRYKKNQCLGRYISKHATEEDLKFCKSSIGSFAMKQGARQRSCISGDCGNCKRCIARIRKRIYGGTISRVEIPARYVKEYQDALYIWGELCGPYGLLSSSLSTRS